MIRFLLSASATLVLIWALDRSWPVAGNRLPPPGKFLDPFHGFWRNAEPEAPMFRPGAIPGLEGKVAVLFDSAMIPHIYASNEGDLFRAQGYVAAYLRLWQMEFQLQASAGRLSEIVGERAIDYDRLQRRLGIPYAAENAYQALKSNPLAYSIATQYAEGVNAYIESLSYEDLPFEYKLLDYEPEEWTPYKSALLLKMMANTLNAGSKDVAMTNALKAFGKDTVDLLFPDRETVGDPIVSRPGQWKFDAVHAAADIKAPAAYALLNDLPETDPNNGSNNWAVSGQKTAGGTPILCNDPHLNTTLPSIWLAMHLNAPGVNCMGVTLPGSPNLIIGFNDSIAWGVTNAQRDLVDWYRIESDKKDSYLYEGGRRPFRKKIETIVVRDSDSVRDTVLYTHHGPIVYDASYESDNARAYFAYRWISHEDSLMRGENDGEIITFYKLNRSRNHDDYMEALGHYASPAQNFVFASVQGDIAMRIQGRFPIRAHEQGRFILDGTKKSDDWNAFIPYEQNVMDKNPLRGFVSSANQYPADETYPHYITAQSYEAYRNRRINQVLSMKNGITPKDMMDLQNDNYNLRAAEVLPIMLGLLDATSLSEEESVARQSLLGWDLMNDEDSEGAAYFTEWWNVLFPSIWDEMQAEGGPPLPVPTSYRTIEMMRTVPQLRFFDIAQTPEIESLKDLVNHSFREMAARIGKWKAEQKSDEVRWADYKDTFVPHLLRLGPLGVKVQHGGGGSIVNASSRSNGPSWRMVVSLEKRRVRAWGVYPGGQSGNPGSPYYSNWVDPWGDAQYASLNFWKTAGEAEGKYLGAITLRPR
jgi:penicillin amidase